MLCQIERGLANPSLGTLRLIAANLDVPMFSFFDYTSSTKAHLVKKQDRVRIIRGKSDSNELELGYDLLSPDLEGVVQLCEMTLGPKQISSDKLNSHDAEEVAVCTEGTIELHLENDVVTLQKGDSIRLDNNTPHLWKNPTNEICAIIFALSPPTF